MSAATGWAITGVAIVVTCWVIPAVAMRMLVPSLEASAPRVENYRGRQVFLGLGIVWIFWIGGLVLLLIALGVEQTLVPAGESSAALMSSIPSTSSWTAA